MKEQNSQPIRLRDNAIWQSMRTAEERGRDGKYDQHMAGDCEWEDCEWCIAATIAAEESRGG